MVRIWLRVKADVLLLSGIRAEESASCYMCSGLWRRFLQPVLVKDMEVDYFGGGINWYEVLEKNTNSWLQCLSFYTLDIECCCLLQEISLPTYARTTPLKSRNHEIDNRGNGGAARDLCALFKFPYNKFVVKTFETKWPRTIFEIWPLMLKNDILFVNNSVELASLQLRTWGRFNL